ncbi:MAG TPA: type II secretion system protein GspG [Pyrinomonadaceae bacterium]
MNAWKIRTALMFPLLACCVTIIAAANVRADLTPRQARKAITRMAGFELKDGSVRVKSISATNASAEVSAEIRTVFKFSQDKEGTWRVAEIRTGQDRWDEIDFIAEALKTQVVTGACNALDPPAKGSLARDPSVKRARCLLGSLLGVEIPSDAIRIQEVEPMPVPLATQASASVIAWVKIDARLLNDRGGWRVSELRTGNRDWVRLEPLIAALNEAKMKRARAELELIAGALEKFRRERGFYVVSDSQAVAIDHLSPGYLAQVIRLDPWQKPYMYQGERDHFILRSAGPDGKADTPDDILLSNPH